MHLQILGAAREVTGSCFLIESGGLRFLIDCGLFQGGREADAKNRNALGEWVRDLDFVLLTHAHIDHSGLLPRLVGLGFRGPIHTTRASADLLEPMLLDAAHIQEYESQRQKERHRAGPAWEPLYTSSQALRTLTHLRPVAYDESFSPAPGVEAVFREAGHILGSAFIELAVTEGSTRRHLLFSGDIGSQGRPLVRDPARPTRADVLITESTYGNRLHRSLQSTLDELVQAITQTLKRKGNVIIPAFAVGRTQELLYLLIRLHREGRLPGMKIFVDSPLATKATAVTLKHWQVLDPDVGPIFDAGMKAEHDLSIRFVESPDESAELSRSREGAIIIAGSGMCDAGRIKFHLRANLPREESSVIIIGFQAQGTLGRRLVDGAREVRILGDETPVRAQMHTIGGLSAHADRDGLLNWMSALPRAPQKTLVVHGEHSTALAFAADIETRLGWSSVSVPAQGDRIEL